MSGALMAVISFNRKHNIKTKEKVLEATAPQRKTYVCLLFFLQSARQATKTKEKNN